MLTKSPPPLKCCNTLVMLTLIVCAQRYGRPSELLLGPLQYGVVHMVLTAMWWRTSPVGIVGVACLVRSWYGSGLSRACVQDY